MLDIIVRRDPYGPYKLEDVIEPLLGSSVDAGICLGSALLDEKGTGAQVVEYTVYYRAGLRCGLIVQLYDSLSMRTIVGKIVGISLTAERTDGTSIVPKAVVRLLIPTSFFSVST